MLLKVVTTIRISVISAAKHFVLKIVAKNEIVVNHKKVKSPASIEMFARGVHFFKSLTFCKTQVKL